MEKWGFLKSFIDILLKSAVSLKFVLSRHAPSGAWHLEPIGFADLKESFRRKPDENIQFPSPRPSPTMGRGGFLPLRGGRTEVGVKAIFELKKNLNIFNSSV